MKTVFTIIVMLSITPISAAIGLISFNPSIWGGSLSIGNVLGIAFFGIITVPLWITYIPSLIIAPIIMRKISNNDKFQKLSIKTFISLSLILGAVIGIFVLSPVIIMVITDNTLSYADMIKLVSNWSFAGALSGAVSLPIISLIYRKHLTSE